MRTRRPEGRIKGLSSAGHRSRMPESAESQKASEVDMCHRKDEKHVALH